MKKFLVLALDLQKHPERGCPECKSNQYKRVGGPAIASLIHKEGCSLENDIHEWVNANDEQVKDIK